jgi:pimeloyl-ACP methyl ester carboxylesterase
MGRARVAGAVAVASAGLVVSGLLAPSAASAAPSRMSGAGPVAVFARCPAGTTPSARCGTVSVPLDRAKPDGARIAIAFQLYPATDRSRRAVSTIVSSNGGPGVSNIASAPFWLSRLRPVMARRNFLAIDHRGIGASQAIDCPALQHVLGSQVAASRACGASLGPAAYRYGSGDVADDVDAVRQALHLDKIDYDGVSYGAVDVRAYAYRYPQHLRSAILDSPYNSQDPAFVRTLPTAMARISVLVCERSPSCAAANPHPARTFTDLVQRLQQHPITGTGYDADGRPHDLVVNETALLGVLYNDYFADPAFLNQGEIFAAATALSRGDAVPLLRLVAESPAPTDFGPSNGPSSVGADYAVFCADSRFPWNKYAPEARRQAQYAAALRALPADATTPFTPAVWASFIASQPVLLIPGANACVPWPKPVRPDPPFPNNQPFPHNVPALLLGGGLDYLDINSERSLMPLFPTGRFVTVANAGHVTTFWNPCAQAIALRFLQTLRVGNTRCAADTTGAMGNPFGSATGKLHLRGVASFPTYVKNAVPARDDPRRDLDTPLADRRIATAVWLTVTDAVYRLPRMTTTHGRGLRGGSYTVTTTPAGTTIDYQGARFTDDVYVTGRVRLTPDNRLTGQVNVIAPHPQNGTLSISAVLWDPAHPLASLTGTVHGRQIAVLTQTR